MLPPILLRYNSTVWMPNRSGEIRKEFSALLHGGGPRAGGGLPRACLTLNIPYFLQIPLDGYRGLNPWNWRSNAA